jgi:hypothetical protein
MEGKTPRLPAHPAPGLKPGANGHKACFQQAWLRVALPFNGRAGFWAFGKAICNRCPGVIPLIRQRYPLRSRGF